MQRLDFAVGFSLRLSSWSSLTLKCTGKYQVGWHTAKVITHSGDYPEISINMVMESMKLPIFTDSPERREDTAAGVFLKQKLLP